MKKYDLTAGGPPCSNLGAAGSCRLQSRQGCGIPMRPGGSAAVCGSSRLEEHVRLLYA